MKKINLGKKVVSASFIIFLILAALVNLIIFAVFSPTELETSDMKMVFWFSYGFLMLAFVMQLVSIWTGRFENGIEAAFFGFPLIRVSMFYFVMTAILSLVFMALVSFSIAVPFVLMLVLECILVGLFAVVFIMAATHKEAITQIDQVIKQNVRAIRAFVTDIECMAEAAADSTLKSKLNALAEEFRYSDPMTNDAVRDLDMQLSDAVAELEVLVAEGDVQTATSKITQIKLTLSKRNRRLADSK